MARRDEEEILFLQEEAFSLPESVLPSFPDGPAIESGLAGIHSECVKFGSAGFLTWVDLTLEDPDEIREFDGPEEPRLYHYISYLEHDARTPAFVVELCAFDDTTQVSGFSLILQEHDLERVRSGELLHCRTTEWQKEKLVRSLNEQALDKYEENSLDEAKDLIDSAIRFGGINRAYLYNNRGLISWRMGRTEDAKKDFLRSISLERDNGDPYFNIGLIYFDESDFDRALHFLRRAVETDPQDGQFLTELGHLYLELEREEEALQFFSRALENDPADPQVEFHLGHYFLYKKRKPRNAVKYFHRGLKKDPEDQFAMADLAVAHWVLGHNRKSMDLHRMLQRKSPLMPYTISRMVYLNVEMGDYENALKYYHEALNQTDQFEPEWLHYNAAVVYAKTGHPKQALDTLGLAVKAGGEAVIKRALSDKALHALTTMPDFQKILRINHKRGTR